MNHAFDNGWNIKDIHTNLAMKIKSPEVFEVLLKHENIHINVGGGTRKTHFKNTKTNLRMVLVNLKILWRMKERRNSKTNIIVKMVLNKNNLKEKTTLRGLINQISPNIPMIFSPLYYTVSDGANKDKLRFFSDNLITNSGELDVRIPTRENIFVEDNKIIIKPKKRRFPKSLFCYTITPTVRVNGDVHLCCRSRWYGKSAGNAFTTPIKDIMKGKLWKKYARRVKWRRYCEYCKYCS
jgi:hypothetical protein